MFKNLILLYPSGSGGSHLANLLSCNETCNPRFQVPDYPTQLYQAYLSRPGDANFIDLQGFIRGEFNSEYFKTHLDRLLTSEQTNVLCGHLSDLIQCLDYVKALPDAAYITFDLPIEGQLRKRIQTCTEIWGEYAYHEQIILYKDTTIRKLTGAEINKVFTFPADRIIDTNVDYIKDFLKNFLQLDLPDICDELHNVWINDLFNLTVL